MDHNSLNHSIKEKQKLYDVWESTPKQRVQGQGMLGATKVSGVPTRTSMYNAYVRTCCNVGTRPYAYVRLLIEFCASSEPINYHALEH